MKKFNIFLLFCCITTTTVMAQDITIKSQLRSTDGSPVGNAIISVKGLSSATLSDESGFFELTLNTSQAILNIRAEGFYEKELPLSLLVKKGDKDKSAITLIPQDDAFYSTTTTKIENKDFSENISVGSALRDGVSGLQVINKSGMPNEGSYMNVRGVHSFIADNQPLIVINGVPYFGSTDVSELISGYSRDILFGYDPKDIKSVTLLKGAEAAEWGSLSSSGVLLIETQQATSDNLETRISFSGHYGINLKRGTLPVMNSNQYKSYMNDIGMTRYSTTSSLTADYPFLSNSASPYSYLFNENTNWMDEIQRTGFTTENLFRVEGGDEIAKYNISFGYNRNEGTLRNTNSDKYHTLISADVLVSRKVDIFANIGLSYITSNLNNQGATIETNPILSSYLSMPLINPYAKQEDGSILSTLAAYDAWNSWNSLPTYSYDNVSNPLALATTVKAKDKIYDVNMNAGLNFQWNSYLTLTAMINLYYNYTEETIFIPGVSDRAIVPLLYGTGENMVGNNVTHQRNNTYQLQGRYKRTFENVHELNASIFSRVITRKLEIDISEGYNTANDFYKTLDNTQNGKDSWGSDVEWNYLGFGLNADYTYNKILDATAGLTVDGTSVSGVDASRFGLFPFGKITFLVANTGWLPSSWFNVLNISLGASLSGNSRFSSNYGKSYYESNNFFDIATLVRSSTPNTKLTWEKKRQFDLGLDVSLLQNKIQFGIDFFYSYSYDLLLSRDVSSIYGSSIYYDNTGEVSGKGLEVMLRINPIHTKDFDFVLSASLATVKNRVESLGGDSYITTTYSDYNSDDAMTITSVGSKPYEFYGFETAGVYATSEEADNAGLVNAAGVNYQAGDMIFVDQNGDGVIDDNDRVCLGSSQPTLYGGINLMFRYKKFSLDFNFGYSMGNYLYNATRRQLESMSTFNNQSTAVLNRWQIEGQQADIPRAVYGDPAGNSSFSDRWIEKGDYLKLRSVKFAYTFKNLFSFIRSGDVYVQADNLFNITKYLGSDPEFAYSYDESLRGFDYSKLTSPVTIKVGFNLNF